MHSLSVHTNVSALECIGSDILLCGIGGTIECYYKSKFKTSKVVFRRQNIHRIEIFLSTEFSTKLIILGGKYFQIITLLHLKHSAIYFGDDVSSGKCSNWLLEAKVLQNKVNIVLLSSHNQAVVLYGLANTFKQDPIYFECTEKSLLYAGCLISELTNGFVVLAGTVFSEILIWAVTDIEIVQGPSSVLHRLTGHEGVIFAICYLDFIICSTSDDRTARLWQVDHSDKNNWTQEMSIKPMHVIGAPIHSARIFRNFLLHCDGRLIAISAGEDSVMCFWDVMSGFLINKVVASHGGSPIWCVTRSSDGLHVYTGGGDGAVRTWSLMDLMPLKSRTIFMQTLQKYDYPKIVMALSNMSFVLILTHQGKILCHDINAFSTCILVDSEIFKNYAVMKADESILVLGTLSGELYIYKLDRLLNRITCKLLQRKQIHDGKIFSLFLLPDDMIVTCGGQNVGTIKLHHFICRKDGLIEILKTFQLPQPQIWLTAALSFGNNSFLAVGDRNGGIHVYSNLSVPIKSFMEIHGRLGVAAIRCVIGDDFAFWSVGGRDGYLRKFVVFSNRTAPDVKLVSAIKIDLRAVEDIRVHNSQVFVLGFFSTKFNVYNLTEDYNVTQLDCGGPYRSWSWCFTGNDCGTFVFIKEKHVNIYKDVKFTPQPLRRAFHTKPVSAVHHFVVGMCHYVATAGEDGVIRIHQYNGRDVVCLRGHISSIKCVRTCILDAEDFTILVSVGGRAQLKVWHFTEANVLEKATHFLKGNDKHRSRNWRDQGIIYDTETRYMDLALCLNLCQNTLLIVAVCSEGILRLFRYDIGQSKFFLVFESQRQKHAFLKVKLWPINKSPNGDPVFVSTATNGQLSFWLCNSSCDQLNEDTSLRCEQLHQSGINSIDIVETDMPLVCVYTGGDDGSINCSSFECSNDRISCPKLLWSMESAHLAQISGIAVINVNDTLFCVSVSTDQQITLWRLSIEDICERPRVLLHTTCYVADVQDMLVWKSSNDLIVVVGGNGVEYLSFESPKDL